MSETMINIFRKFLIVAFSLVLAGTSSGFSTDTEIQEDSTDTESVVGCCCAWNGGRSAEISRQGHSHHL